MAWYGFPVDCVKTYVVEHMYGLLRVSAVRVLAPAVIHRAATTVEGGLRGAVVLTMGFRAPVSGNHREPRVLGELQ